MKPLTTTIAALGMAAIAFSHEASAHCVNTADAAALGSENDVAFLVRGDCVNLHSSQRGDLNNLDMTINAEGVDVFTTQFGTGTNLQGKITGHDKSVHIFAGPGGDARHIRSTRSNGTEIIVAPID